MQYLLESSICLALLYAFYHLALRRESFFQFNRGYLLLAPLLAFAVPALNIRLDQELKDPVALPIPQPEVAVAPVADWPVIAVERMQAAPRLIGKTLEKPVWALSLGEILWWIYGVVGTLFLLRLLVQIFRLARFIRFCKKETRDGFVLATAPAETPVASFFGFVFWNPGYTDDEDHRLIFEHELVHVRQWHSLDLIFIELLIALQWFNPLLYAYRRSLREVHEYIADDYVVRRTRQRYAYAALLVRQHSAGNGAQPGLVNTFHSLIQKRLIMLAKQPSHPFRRAKYLLALPLFATLMLLFSFRLADKLPEVRKATALLETYASTLSETVVLGDKPVERFEPKPYIFYWGNFEVRLTYEESAGQYTATLNLTADALLEGIKREPRLWTGETLLERLTFTFNGISVSSDYNRPEVYETIQTALKNNAKVLQEGDQVVLSNLSLPDGLKGQIAITISKSATPPVPVIPAKAEINAILWGGKTFVQGEKRYITVSEFWEMLQAEARVRFSDQKEVQPEAWNVALYNEKGAVIRARADRKDALTTEQLRERLDQETAAIKPGATLSFSAWELQEYGALPETLDTIITFDPVIYEETVQIIMKGGGVANLRPATELLSLSIVKDLDPRRFLKAEDLHDYTFKWSALTEYIPRSAFAQSYISKGFGSRIHGDGVITMWSSQFTKKEILQMLREKAALFQGEIPLKDFNFTISYNGDGKLIENGNVPDDLVEKLEKELKPGEVIKITGLQARENTVRYLVLPANARHYPELVKVAQKTEILAKDKDQQLVRLTLSLAEFNRLQPKLENVSDIWLQYGDIDLTPFTFELEVRDEDPKPGLPFTKTKGGIFTVKLSVSPNPVRAREAVSAVVTVQKPGQGKLTVTNAEGRQLFAQQVEIGVGENKLEIPAQPLNVAGIYIIRLEMSYGVGSAKLVVE